MHCRDPLSPEVSTTYRRAYELAAELARGERHPEPWGPRADGQALEVLLAQVLRRMGAGKHEDPGLIVVAVRDVLEARRSANTGLTDSETSMNPIFSSLVMAPLVPVGCLTLPLEVSVVDCQITTYDYGHPVWSAA
jgi:hypothetical protein